MIQFSHQFSPFASILNILLPIFLHFSPHSSPFNTVLFIDVCVSRWVGVALVVQALALLDLDALAVDVLVHTVWAEALLVAVLGHHTLHGGNRGLQTSEGVLTVLFAGITENVVINALVWNKEERYLRSI